MKAVLTLLFVFTFGVSALANNTNTPVVKVTTIEMTVVLNTVNDLTPEVNMNTANNVARLYKFKNSRVKKALAFSTKRNKAKLA